MKVIWIVSFLLLKFLFLLIIKNHAGLIDEIRLSRFLVFFFAVVLSGDKDGDVIDDNTFSL